jgi:Ran GTPase-activating protein (RanGAP) involved in mRNA processing and transport
LQDIRLDMNKIDDAKQIIYNCQLDKLRKFSVRDNAFGCKGCFYIQVYATRNLLELNLSKNDIQDEGMAFLTGASYLRNLQKLFLDENNLTHTSGKYFGDSQYLTQLR